MLCGSSPGARRLGAEIMQKAVRGLLITHELKITQNFPDEHGHSMKVDPFTDEKKDFDFGCSFLAFRLWLSDAVCAGAAGLAGSDRKHIKQPKIPTTNYRLVH